MYIVHRRIEESFGSNSHCFKRTLEHTIKCQQPTWYVSSLLKHGDLKQTKMKLDLRLRPPDPEVSRCGLAALESPAPLSTPVWFATGINRALQ